jgi:hypothetical protein
MRAAENLVLGGISLQFCNVIQQINYYYYYYYYYYCNYHNQFCILFL